MSRLAEVLPSVNATLNATSAILLVLGFRAIRAGRRETHRAFMLAAVASSVLFLAGSTLGARAGRGLPGDGIGFMTSRVG